MKRTTSSSASSRPSSMQGSSAVPLEVYPYSNDATNGVQRSCRIRPHTKNHFHKGSELGYLVTLQRAGQKEVTRFLANGIPPSDRLDKSPRRSTFPNKDRPDKWRPSLVDETDQDPTGQQVTGNDPIFQDPGSLVYLYEGNYLGRYGTAFDCLEVLARADTSGPWMIQPIARKERADRFKAKQNAEADAKQALREQQRKEQEEAVRDARALINSARRGSGDAAVGREAAALGQSRRISNGSLASTSARKGPRTSITSIATNQTSTSAARPGTGASRHRLGRALFHRKEKA